MNLEDKTIELLLENKKVQEASDKKTIFNDRETLLDFVNKYSKYEWVADLNKKESTRGIVCKDTINNDWENRAIGFYTQNNKYIYLVYNRNRFEDLTTEQKVKDAIEKIDKALDKDIKKKKSIKWTYHEDENHKWYAFVSNNYYFNIYIMNNSFVLIIDYSGPDGMAEIHESEYNTLEEAQEAATTIYLSL